jgi:hypothetical protein
MKNHILFILFLVLVPPVFADISNCDSLLNQSKTEFQIEREYDRCIIKNLAKPEDCKNIKDKSRTQPPQGAGYA